jgi:hypothetical protein
MRELVGWQLPTFQARIKLAKHVLILLAIERFSSVFVVLVYILRAEFHHFLHREVAREGSILVAIDAILLILAAIGIGAEQFICERHAAALTKF